MEWIGKKRMLVWQKGILTRSEISRDLAWILSLLAFLLRITPIDSWFDLG